MGGNEILLQDLSIVYIVYLYKSIVASKFQIQKYQVVVFCWLVCLLVYPKMMILEAYTVKSSNLQLLP